MNNLPARPLVTFALFTYNQEQFIAEAVAAALAQDYEPLEIIVSDDCSTDSTFEIASKVVSAYVGKHTVLLVKNERNLGIGRHFEKILSNARGEIFVMAAGDDVSCRERTSVAVEAMISDPAALGFISGFKYIDKNSKEEQGRWVPSREGFSLHAFARGDINVPGAAAVWSRKVVEGWSSIENVIHEDRVFPFRVALLGGSIASSEQALVSYRSTGGVSRSPSAATVQNARLVRMKALARIRPDALMRLVDFEAVREGQPRSLELELKRALALIDIEIGALRASGLGLEFGYVKLATSGVKKYQALRRYAKVRFSFLYAAIAQVISAKSL